MRYLLTTIGIAVTLGLIGLGGVSLAKLSESKPHESTAFIVLDVEQALYDQNKANSGVSGSQWTFNRAKELCAQHTKCILLEPDAVIGGDVFNVNAEYRKLIGLTEAASVPTQEDVQFNNELLEELKKKYAQ